MTRERGSAGSSFRWKFAIRLKTEDHMIAHNVVVSREQTTQPIPVTNVSYPYGSRKVNFLNVPSCPAMTSEDPTQQ